MAQFGATRWHIMNRLITFRNMSATKRSAPATELTHLDHALLGLIDMGCRSGYDILQVFKTTALGGFSSSPGAIYPALARLDRRNLLSSKLESPGRTRRRRVYALTQAGERAHEVWLRQPVTRDELERHPQIPFLRFSMSETRVTRQEATDYLLGFRKLSEAYLDELRSQVDSLPGGDVLHPRLALEHGIASVELQIEWIDRAVRRLRRAASKPKSVTPR